MLKFYVESQLKINWSWWCKTHGINAPGERLSSGSFSIHNTLTISFKPLVVNCKHIYPYVYILSNTDAQYFSSLRDGCGYK